MFVGVAEGGVLFPAILGSSATPFVVALSASLEWANSCALHQRDRVGCVVGNERLSDECSTSFG